MAYKTKFLHFKTKASYEAERAKTTEGSEERKVFDAYISFIDEGPTICTWGKEYQCDANSLSLLPQELTTEEQNQVFKNLGWNVHIISQSDINAGSSPSDEEKAKLLEATALLVKETSNIYLRGNDDSNNHYFFRVNTSYQLEILRLSIITGIIYRITSQFIDTGSIRYDKTQSLTEDQKAQARKNIDAASKEEVLPLTIDISNTSVEDYNIALEAFNSKKPLTIFDSSDPTVRFTSTTIEKETDTNDINIYFSFTGISNDNAINTFGYITKIKSTGEKTESFVSITPSNLDPKPLASVASPGTDNAYSRSDHVHPIQESVNKLTTPRVIAISGAVSGSATFDGSSNVSINSTLNSFDASKITSGTLNADRLPEIPISKIPAAAMERLYVVESQSAAMSLTIQEGDVVQIGSGGPMYFCVSESASTFATKFKVFTAGAATSVPWSGVTNAPTKLSQFSNDAGYLTSVPAQTWASITGKPSTFTPSAHTQSYTTLTGSTTTANQAIVSNGTANGWTLKTLGSNAFNSTSYIPTSVSVVASTLAAGSSATASYDASTNKFTFGIPRGATGAQGPKGDKGDTGATGPAGTYTAGANITISGNVISATDTKYTLPTASSSVLGGVKVGSNITLSYGTISLSKSNVTSALGYTPANTSDIPEIPIALPNPYALTINGTSYTGSSAVSINTARILSTATLSSSTVSAGYSYNNTSSRTISSLRGFSSSNPDSVIISTAKLTFTASNAIKMDGLADLSGTYYIYCLSYMANEKIAVNGAVYA